MILRLCAMTLGAAFVLGCPGKPADPPQAAGAEAPIDEEAIKAEAAQEAAKITKANAEAEAARLEAELADE